MSKTPFSKRKTSDLIWILLSSVKMSKDFYLRVEDKEGSSCPSLYTIL